MPASATDSHTKGCGPYRGVYTQKHYRQERSGSDGLVARKIVIFCGTNIVEFFDDLSNFVNNDDLGNVVGNVIMIFTHCYIYPINNITL